MGQRSERQTGPRPAQTLCQIVVMSVGVGTLAGMDTGLELAALGEIGTGLARPECVLAHESGWLFVPDWRGTGGVAIIFPDGSVRRLHARTGAVDAAGDEADRPTGLSSPLRPNGIALEANGSFLLAHLGDSEGGVYRLRPDGEVELVVGTLDGEPLPPTNFVVADGAGRLWITVSTRVSPRADDYRSDACSGLIAVALPGESDARIVADGLGYANECVVDIGRGAVHVNETFGRRLTSFTLEADGSLTERRVLASFGAGTYPDGLALDVEGSLLVTSIVSNRLLRVDPDGGVEILLEDADAEHLALTEAAYERHALGREHLERPLGTRLQNISNLAFGGPDLRTAWLGNLLGTTIPCLRLPVAGAEMTHYRVPLGPLEALK